VSTSFDAAFCPSSIFVFCFIVTVKRDASLNGISMLVSVVDTGCVVREVRTVLFNIV
jgi:hypothetical protein